MQIADNNSLNNGPLEQTSRAADTQATGSPVKGAGSPASTSQNDGVQISNFAGTLSHVLQSDSTDRSQRIAQLAAAVQSGSYQVDPMAVSRAIIDHTVSGANSLA
jgi:flagellar biosynthesis anti-sigma factor FlgM